MMTVGSRSQAFIEIFGCTVSNCVITLDTVRRVRTTGTVAGARSSSRAVRRFLSGLAAGIQGATPPPGG